MNATISMREYLDKRKPFMIPNYQRGYVWGQTRKGRAEGSMDSVSYMLESLLKGYDSDVNVFIQGVTVSESNDSITVIDGQQRTTFFFLLLRYLGFKGRFALEYMIRKESNEYLSSEEILSDYCENPDEEFQDIYFLKKTLRIIDKRLKEKAGLDYDAFMQYILDHVKFLYIDIPEHKAKTVFTMMNGNKAEMKSEELIKAELLRVASLNDNRFDRKPLAERIAIDWDNNMLRSRFAREWDKWLQWWNRDDVANFFKTDGAVMGLLIDSFLKINGEHVSFDCFKKKFLHTGRPVDAKKAFEKLRRLQKRFEDSFNNAVTFNKIGAILRVVRDKDQFNKWYFGGTEVPPADELDRYYKWCFLGVSHKKIMENDKEEFDRAFDETYAALSSDTLYFDNADIAFKLLLRLNIDEDSKLEDSKGRKFDFSIWDRRDSRGRSLEHIYPKSKVWHEESDGENSKCLTGDGSEISADLKSDPEYISRDSCRYTTDSGNTIVASEHSIGNLVLLYKDDNSSFNASSYEEKKMLFFKGPHNVGHKNAKDIFKSRHLLHTVYQFALSSWDGTEIAKNKYKTLKDFCEYYGKQD